jgi:hypothetical protein
MDIVAAPKRQNMADMLGDAFDDDDNTKKKSQATKTPIKTRRTAK